MALTILFQAIYFIFPAYIANMLPSAISKTRFLNFLVVPVDFGLKIKNNPVFGKNKTVRGFVIGIAGAILFALLQKSLYNQLFFRNISIIDYSTTSPILIGFLLGFGALLGDVIESFVKRRMRIKPGSRFIPWDQMDYIIGALLLVSLAYIPPVQIIIILILISPVLHLLINIIAYFLKLKKVWW